MKMSDDPDDKCYESYDTLLRGNRLTRTKYDREPFTTARDSDPLLDVHVWLNNKKCPVTAMDGKGNGLWVHYNEDGTVYAREFFIHGRQKAWITDDNTLYGGTNPAVKTTWKQKLGF
jgi:hypothetical protein